MGEYISYSRIDEFEQENPTKEQFIAFLAGEDYSEQIVTELCEEYGY